MSLAIGRRLAAITRRSGRPPCWVLGLATLVLAAAVFAGSMLGASPAGAAPGRPMAPVACTPGQTTYSGVIPDGCYGDYPVKAYDISYAVGIDPRSWGRNMMGFLTGIAFDVGTWFVALAQWSIGWAYKFPIDQYTGATTDLSAMYRGRIFSGALGTSLTTLAYSVLFVYVGFNVLRNRASMALGELVTSVALVACSTFLVGNLAGYVNGMWDLMGHGTAAMLVAADPESTVSPATANKNDIDGAVRRVQGRLHGVFIDEAYDMIQWGGPLKEPCKKRRNEILSGNVDTSWWYDVRDKADFLDTGIFGANDQPYQLMGDLSECEDVANFNATPSSDRLGSAVLCMLASITVGLVLTAMALTMVVGNFVVVILFGVSPFLLLFAALPGSGRRLGWLWLTTLVQAVVVDLGLAFVLSMTLTIMQIVLKVTGPAPDGTGGRPLIERMALILCLGVLLGVVRNKMTSAGSASAGRITDNLTNVRMGGGGVPWQGPTSTRGFDLGVVGSSFESASKRALSQGAIAIAAGTAAGAALAVTGTGRIVAQRLRERRMWHNTVKARLMGDQISMVSDRSYIGSDLVGSQAGVMPRAGYPATTPGGPGAGGVLNDVTDVDLADLMASHPDNLWVKAARANLIGDQAGYEYYRGMATLHANYPLQAGRGGADLARSHYDAQAQRLRLKYNQRTDGNPGPGIVVERPWDVASSGRDNLGNPRPDPTRPPIAHLAGPREFGESVRHAPVYPAWAYEKRYLRRVLRQGDRAAATASRLQRQVAARRGYDI
jgi:hypothetical protein